MNLSYAWRLYESDKRLARYADTTLDAYRLQAKLLIQHVGDIKLDALDLPTIKDYLISLSHLTPMSLTHRIKFLRSMLRWASDEGYIQKNPIAKLKDPKLGKRLPKALDIESIEILRDSCKTSFERSLIEFLHSTGCRLDEVYNLNRTSLNMTNLSIVVIGKGDREREVYFSIICRLWLNRYLASRKDNDTALFVTERMPHRMSKAQLRFIVKKIADRTDISVSVYPHRFRHSYATHLLDKGCPLEAISDFLGHARISTTKIYAQLSSARRSEIYKRYF